MDSCYFFPATWGDVARAVLLADHLKGDAADDAFRERLGLERLRLAGLSDADALAAVTDAARRDRYRRACWSLTVVPLDRCRVWDGMGQLAWVENMRVPDVAGGIRDGRPPGRVLAVQRHARRTFGELPLVATRGPAAPPGTYFLDDGNNRAVAYYLAGFREAFAFVGDLE